MIRRLFGLRGYASIYNRALIGYYLGAIAGPLMVGWSSDRLHSPAPGLAVASAVCLASIAVVWRLPAVGASTMDFDEHDPCVRQGKQKAQ